MAFYKIIQKDSVRSDFKKVNKPDIPRIVKKIYELAENPRPAGYKKLTDEKKSYRVRIGDYRIIYRVDDKESIILIIAVNHRKDVYRRM